MVAFAQSADPGDEALVAALQAHEESALTELRERYRNVLIGVIMKVAKDPTESEDILQEVLLQIWERIGSFDASKGKLSSWIITVARRRAIDRVRQNCAYRRATDRFEVEIEHGVAGFRIHEANDVCIVDFRRMIDRLLGLLPRFQREAIALSFLDGRSQREISVLTGTPLGTVKTRIELGMKKLAQSIGTQRDKIL